MTTERMNVKADVSRFAVPLCQFQVARIIATGSLLMALSVAAQDVSGASSVSTQQIAVSSADNLLVQSAQILEEANQPTDIYVGRYIWADLAYPAARAKDTSLAIRAARSSKGDSDSIARVAVVLMKDGRKKEAYEVIGLLAASEPPVVPELIAYDTLVKSQVASGDITGAKETVELMQKIAGKEEAESMYVEQAQRNIAQAQEAGNRSVDLKAALDTAKSISDPTERGLLLVVIAVKQMEKGDRAGSAEMLRLGEQLLNQSKQKKINGNAFAAWAKAEARLGNVKKAIEIANGLSTQDISLMGGNAREFALAQIAFEQARAGDVVGAVETVQQIKLEASRFETLELIVRWQLRQHDNASALQTCQRILDLPVTPKLRDSRDYLKILVRTAEYQNQAGDGHLSEKTIARVVNEENSIKEAAARDEVIGEVAGALARSGDFEGAIKQVEQIKDWQKFDSMEPYKTIAKAQAEKKQFSGAMETITMASAKCSKNSPPPLTCGSEGYAFPGVLRVLARLGDEEDALNWANGQSSRSDRARALVAVAQGLLDRVSPYETETTRGRDEDDLETFEALLELKVS